MRLSRWARIFAASLFGTALLVVPALPGAADGNEAPGAPVAFRSIAAGGGQSSQGHTCGILPGGDVTCWGSNSDGQLGLGDTITRGDDPGEVGANVSTIDLGTGRSATAITAGAFHTCAILDDGTVKCWGKNNNMGQLGLGDLVNRGDNAGEMGDNLPAVDLGTGRTATAITSLRHHTCAILDNGSVKCWGEGASGRLGNGESAAFGVDANVGDNAGEMGDDLLPVELGSGRTAIAVTAGYSHTCAILDDGSVKCWGAGSNGTLGVGDTTNRGDEPNEMGDNLPVADLGTGRTATAITAGGDGTSGSATCALLDDGTVKCWGKNSHGQLGLGDTASRGDAPGEMGDDLPPVALGTGRTATAITTGSYRTCALLDDDSLKCWGRNLAGSLGLGLATSVTLGDGPGEMGDDLPALDLGTGRSVVSMSAGPYHACAALDNGDLKCWGSNGAGQLGVGDNADRGDAPGEMGDALPPVPLFGSGITGTVSRSTGGVIGGALVAALSPIDYSIVGGSVATPDGRYSLAADPGNHLVYTIDPTGVSAAGFFGAPTQVTVTAGQRSPADPSLAPLRGQITGTITTTGGGPPIAGAWAIAIDAATGSPRGSATADGAGAYTVADLHPGSYKMVLVDPAGAHTPVISHDIVNVTAGSTATADRDLAAKPTAPTGAALSGQVTETGTGTNLAGVYVVALDASDYTFVRGTTTNAGGLYALNVPAGDYILQFNDPTGRHLTEWHDDQPVDQLGAATPVAAPGVTNAALNRTTGDLTGTVTAPGGAPVNGAWVAAIGPNGLAKTVTTAGDGTYLITQLTPGTYRAAIVNPAAGALEYWQDAPDFFSGSTFNITAAGTTLIDATIG